MNITDWATIPDATPTDLAGIIVLGVSVIGILVVMIFVAYFERPRKGDDHDG